MTRTCDKNRIPFEVGDVLKVYHYTGARRKKHYMYKQITNIVMLGGLGNGPKTPFFFVSHLSLKNDGDREEGYYIGMHDGILTGYEIVQCPSCDFENRPIVDVPEYEMVVSSDPAF